MNTLIQSEDDIPGTLQGGEGLRWDVTSSAISIIKALSTYDWIPEETKKTIEVTSQYIKIGDYYIAREDIHKGVDISLVPQETITTLPKVDDWNDIFRLLGGNDEQIQLFLKDIGNMNQYTYACSDSNDTEVVGIDMTRPGSINAFFGSMKGVYGIRTFFKT